LRDPAIAPVVTALGFCWYVIGVSSPGLDEGYAVSRMPHPYAGMIRIRSRVPTLRRQLRAATMRYLSP
jgi:hypothetical protein